VNGSASPGAWDAPAVVAVVDEEVGAAGVEDDGCEEPLELPLSPEPVAELALELELELELGVEGDEDVDGGVLVVVPASGSTYCWSPADVLVPEASAGAVGRSPEVARIAQQAKIWRR
jgi:hypothetical protein